MLYTIAIDGPVGVGKSSVASDLARELGILHLDTGAMYRTVALAALEHGLDVEDEGAVGALAGTLRLEVLFSQGRQRMLLEGVDVTDRIRTPEVSMAASCVSRYAQVRTELVRMQREIAKTQSMVLDGRDIGTNVLPDATLKIFLTASAEERARRRTLEMRQKGETADFETVLSDVRKRDAQDMGRKLNPLCRAEDAVPLDTGGLTQPQVVLKIRELLETRL